MGSHDQPSRRAAFNAKWAVPISYNPAEFAEVFPNVAQDEGVKRGKAGTTVADRELLIRVAVPKFDFQSIGKAYAEAIKKLQAELAEAAAAAAKRFESFDFKASIDISRDAAERLAKCGWTLPMEFTLRDIAELADKSADDIDAFFVEYYTGNDYAALRRVRVGLLARPALAQWHALLSECFDAFERKNHLITIPALSSVIEGVVAKAGNALTEQRVKLKKICASKAAEATSGVPQWMWRTLELFVEQLFQKAPFDHSRPAFINRHWILHGRDAATWTVADSLRLFNALQTVDSLLE